MVCCRVVGTEDGRKHVFAAADKLSDDIIPGCAQAVANGPSIATGCAVILIESLALGARRSWQWREHEVAECRRLETAALIVKCQPDVYSHRELSINDRADLGAVNEKVLVGAV
jgi:hypothetical protein